MSDPALQFIPNDKFEIIKVLTADVPVCPVSGLTAGWYKNDVTNTYMHNLTFAPVPFAFIVSGGAYYPLNFIQTNVNDGIVDFYLANIVLSVDQNFVYIDNDTAAYFNSSGTLTIGTAPVKIYLCRNIAS